MEYTMTEIEEEGGEDTCEEGTVLASREHEFSEESIVRVGDALFYRHENGGSRGAWDRRGGDGVWRERPVAPSRQLPRQEAIAMLLDWGETPAEASRMTR